MLDQILSRFFGKITPLDIDRIRDSNLTYLSHEKLVNIQKYINIIQSNNIPGIFIEYGVALGGSSIFITSHLKSNRRFVGYDLFGTIPAPGLNDDQKSHDRYDVIKNGRSQGIGGDKYYGYENDLLGKVKSSFNDFGVPVDDKRVTLIKGLFEDTIHFETNTKIAFAHIDCDWYDPVMLCLEQTAPFLQPGGVIILDDYNDYGGCKRATDEFLSKNPSFHLIESTHNAILTRD